MSKVRGNLCEANELACWHAQIASRRSSRATLGESAHCIVLHTLILQHQVSRRVRVPILPNSRINVETRVIMRRAIALMSCFCLAGSATSNCLILCTQIQMLASSLST